MPVAPLRSATPLKVAMAAVMAAFSSASSVDISVMMPSPLKRVWAKIAAMSQVSASVITVPSFPRFFKICLAELCSFLPLSLSWLKHSMSMLSFSASNRSLFFTEAAIQLAVATMSFTRMMPSLSLSMY